MTAAFSIFKKYACRFIMLRAGSFLREINQASSFEVKNQP